MQIILAAEYLSAHNAAELVLTPLCKQLTLGTIKKDATLLQVPEANSSIVATQNGNKQATSVFELAVHPQGFQRKAHVDVLVLASVGVKVHPVACVAVEAHGIVQ